MNDAQLVPCLRQYAEEGWSRHDAAELTGENYKHVVYVAMKNNIQFMPAETGEKRRFEAYAHRTCRTRLIHALGSYLTVKLERENWVDRKIAEYIMSTRQTSFSVSPDELVRFLRAYKNALDAGEGASVKELIGRSVISRRETTIGKIMKKMGLETLYCRHKKHRTTPAEKKDASIRAYQKTTAHLGDIAYFLGLPYHVVYDNVKFRFGKIGEREKYIARFANDYLHYSEASQIYQADDWGWSEGDIAYCFDGKSTTVRHALEHRHEIEPKIINLLDLLYPDMTHDTPYLQKTA